MSRGRAKCANPLFYEWILAKRDKYEPNTKGYFAFKHAAESIASCPDYLATAKDARSLKFIGKGIEEYLDRKLKSHQSAGMDSDDESSPSSASASPKKRGRPRNSQSEDPGRPAKRNAIRSNDIAMESAPVAGPSIVSQQPENRTFGFWYLDGKGNRTSKPGDVEIVDGDAGYKVELAPNCAVPADIMVFDRISVSGRSTGYLSLDDAERYESSTMPLPAVSVTQPAAGPSRVLENLLQLEEQSKKGQRTTLDPSRRSLASSRTASEDSLTSKIHSAGPSRSQSFTRGAENTNSTSHAGLSRSGSMTDSMRGLPSGSQQRPPALGRSKTMNMAMPPPESISHGLGRTVSMPVTVQPEKASGRPRPRLSAAIPPLPVMDDSMELNDSYISVVSQTFPTFDPTVVPAGSFDIVLCLDHREQESAKKRAGIYNRLVAAGLKVEQRALNLGDVVWIAKKKYPTGQLDDEIVLDAVVERKRMDDLCGSIKDGRFHEQKFRLHMSGLTRVYYIVEDFNVTKHKDEFGIQIDTALSSMQVVDHFMVKETRQVQETVDHYVGIHQSLVEGYKHQDLLVLPRNAIKRHNYLDFQKHLQNRFPDRSYLTTYKDFAELNRKDGFMTVQTTWAKMLLTVPGLSAEKAGAIVARYPTMRSLYEYFKQAEEVERFETAATDRENEMLTQSQGGPGKGKGRKVKEPNVAKAMHALKDVTSSATGVRPVGDALSQKLYEVLMLSNYRLAKGNYSRGSKDD